MASQLTITINGDIKNYQDTLKKAKRETESLEDALVKTSKNASLAFAAIAGVIALNVSSFANYEKALIGVGKTTNLSGQELKDLGEEVRKLSKTLPVTTVELLEITQTAAQLGVTGTGNLLKFTETVARLGSATDLSGEEAAAALARILTVTGESVENIDRLGASIVALGNNFAATESEITNAATYISQGIGQFGATSEQVVGLATALKAVGARAELSGSTIGRTFQAIKKAVDSGGKSFENLQALTGLAGDELRETFETNAVEVFRRFLGGLKDVQEGGGSTAKVLEQFKLQGDEINKILPTIARRVDVVTDALNLSSKEYQENTALIKESDTANRSLSAQIKISGNQLENLSAIIGEQLAPVALKFTTNLTNLLNFLQENKAFTKAAAEILLLAAEMTGSIAVIAGAGAGFVKLKNIITATTLAIKGARIATKALIGSTGLGLLIAFAPEIIDAVGSIKKALDFKETPKNLEDTTREINKLSNSVNQLKDDLKTSPSISQSYQTELAIKDLNSQIEGLEELRKTQFKTTQDFGTGQLLMRKEMQQTADLSASLQKQAIPFAPGVDGSEDNREVAKKREDRNAEELQSVATQNEEVLKLREEQIQAEEELRVAQKEAKTEEAELALEEFQTGLTTEQEIMFEARENLIANLADAKEREVALEQLAAHKKTTIAKNELENFKKSRQAKLAFDNQITQQQIGLAQNAANFLVAVQGKQTVASLALGKLAAAASVLVADGQARAAAVAASAAASVAAGPAAPAVFAANLAYYNGLITANTALSLGTIAAQSVQEFQAMANGGLVTGGRPGVDSVPIMAQRNELVSPAQNFEEVIGSVRAKREAEEMGGSIGNGQASITIGFDGDEAANVLTARQIEQRSLGISREG